MKGNKGKRIIIDGKSLAIAGFMAVARGQAGFNLLDKSKSNSQKGYEFLKKELSKGKFIYGANTGFGSNVGFSVSENNLLKLQENLVYSLSCGTAPFLSEEASRGVLLARLNCFAKGYSGVRREILEYLKIFLDKNVLPLIPKYGSIGASGDLVLSAPIALALMGKGIVLMDGKKIPAKKALEKLGLKPIVFMPKEALAVVNNTSVMSSVSALAVNDASYLINLLLKASALYVEVCGGIKDHFAFELQKMKNNAGASLAAEQIRNFLKGSKLAKNFSGESAEEIQDPYSIRCLPYFFGPQIELLDILKSWVENELNSVNDNPVIDWKNKKILHGGNFSGFYIGMGMDILKITLGSLANLQQTIIDRLLDSDKNHIFPPSLARENPGLNSGYKGVGISSGSYFADTVQKVFPHSVLFRPFESGNQDLVSLGTLSAETAFDLVGHNQEMLARLLLVLTEAAEIRGVQNLSSEGKKLCKKIRNLVPVRFADREGLGREISLVLENIRAERL